MFRFGTKTLLFAFVLVALWCSTFSGYAAAGDVRASVLMILFLTAGYLALYSRGRPRAFWLGFFVVMLLMGGNLLEGPVYKYVPSFVWRTQPSPTQPITYYAPVYPQPVPPTPATPSDPIPAPPVPAAIAPTTVMIAPATTNNYQFKMALDATIAAVWMLVLASLVGLIGIWIYRSQAERATH
jgi:hypothetical protein